MKRRFSTSFYKTTELLQKKNHYELKIKFSFQNNRKNIRNQQILQHMRTNVFSFIECMYIHVRISDILVIALVIDIYKIS